MVLVFTLLITGTDLRSLLKSSLVNIYHFYRDPMCCRFYTQTLTVPFKRAGTPPPFEKRECLFRNMIKKATAQNKEAISRSDTRKQTWPWTRSKDLLCVFCIWKQIRPDNQQSLEKQNKFRKKRKEKKKEKHTHTRSHINHFSHYKRPAFHHYAEIPTWNGRKMFAPHLSSCCPFRDIIKTQTCGTRHTREKADIRGKASLAEGTSDRLEVRRSATETWDECGPMCVKEKE